MFRVETALRHRAGPQRQGRFHSGEQAGASHFTQAPPRPATKTVEVKPAHVAAAPVAAPALATPPPAPTVISVKPTHIAATPVTAPTTATPAPAPTVISVKLARSRRRRQLSPGPLCPHGNPPCRHSARRHQGPRREAPHAATPPVSHPLDVPMPAHLQEHVDGNTYFNDTFQFSMFKPPDWKIYEGVPKETGSGIMAMGTEDEQTLLIVDRQVWSGTPKLTSDQVEAKLRQTYQEYHRISEESFECDGQTAIRRTFTGILDGAEWHGVAVHVIHGTWCSALPDLPPRKPSSSRRPSSIRSSRRFTFSLPPPPPPLLLNRNATVGSCKSIATGISRKLPNSL